MHERDFLLKCLQILESDDATVLAYTRAITVNLEDEPVKGWENWGYSPELSSGLPNIRVRACLARYNSPVPLPVFGLIRTDVLQKTHLQGDYPACDLVLLAELALLGKFHEIQEPLFIQRNHGERAGIVFRDDLDLAAEFWDPNHSYKLSMYYWVILGGFLKALRTMPLKLNDRLRCYGEIPVWLKAYRKELLIDVMTAAARIPLIGPRGHRIYMWNRNRKWKKNIRNTAKDISLHVPDNSSFILIDEAIFATEKFTERSIPFISRDGQYWGKPKDDSEAISELERLHDSGVKFVVFASPCFWWFDYYLGFTKYLRTRCQQVFSNKRIIVYEYAE
jgi:hypothetical protein